MKIDPERLRKEERIAMELCCLYRMRGFTEYRMGAFEEYSVYMENKNFLASENMAVFAGADGKLYALRPDVTLSVVKNAKANGCTEKYFYNEKVYRLEKGSRSYKEVSQIGAEIVGTVDRAAEAEIVVLIKKTLAAAGGRSSLDLSHMGYVNGLCAALCASGAAQEELISFLREKNVHDFERYAEKTGIEREKADIFKEVIRLRGEPKRALKRAKELSLNEEMRAAADELLSLTELLEELGAAREISVNFSIANNADYYNGLIFNGYVEGVPKAVLSGGRYDLLAQKFGKKAQAIGFALYLGELGAYLKEDAEKTDVLLLYREGREAAALRRAEELNAAGKSVKIALSSDGGNYAAIEVIK